MKFSIVTITYNSEKYLEQTINSVLSQDYNDFEYIIVDGKSKDSTLDIVKAHARVDKRVRWVSEPDNGIADAMNKGVQMANGEVIAHLHSDDYYPDHSVISSVNSALEKHPGSLWLTGGMFIVNERGMTVNDIKVRDYSFKGLLSNNILLHPSTFIKKQAFEQVGCFNVSLKYAMDYDLWLRLGSICDPILLDRPLACFRVHEGSISTKEVDAAFDEAWKIRKRYLGLNIFKLFFHYNNYRKSRKINRDFVNSLRGDRQDS